MRTIIAILIFSFFAFGCNNVEVHTCTSNSTCTDGEDSVHIEITNHFAYPPSVAPITVPYF